MQQYCSNAAMQQDLEVLLGLLRDRKSGGDAAILLLRIKIGNNRSEVSGDAAILLLLIKIGNNRSKSSGDAAILLLRIKIGNNRSEVRNEQSAAQCVLHVMTGCRQQMVRQAPDVA
jgi:hypothetical protein